MHYRSGTRYEDYLWSRVQTDPAPELSPHVSGFFSKPQDKLDPRVVKGDKVRPDIRKAVLNRLYEFWDKRYRNPRAWSTVWIAGSALAYQWDRAAPDLDVLIGVDFPKFVSANPEFRGLDEETIATRINHEFDYELEPLTKSFDGYEATWYVNPGAQDIRSIMPYAAYDLTHDKWTVRPIEVSKDWNPEAYFPEEWTSVIHTQQATARSLLAQYKEAVEAAKQHEVGSPQWINALAPVRNEIMPQVNDLWSQVWGGRQEGFRPGGEGYYSFGNYRWQSFKHSGIADALHALKVINVHARTQRQIEQYGGALAGAESDATLAQLWNTPYRDVAIEKGSAELGARAPTQGEFDIRTFKEQMLGG